mgnify:CR=1 FL=1
MNYGATEIENIIDFLHFQILWSTKHKDGIFLSNHDSQSFYVAMVNSGLYSENDRNSRNLVILVFS